MTEKTVWVCDGCDAEPSCAQEPSKPMTYHLCVDCTQLLYDRIRPRVWPRTVQPAAA